MATKKSQRVFIWVIAIVMTVGTLAGFLAMILAPQNQQADQKRIQDLTAQYQKEYEAYQQQVEAQGAKLSKKYYAEFKTYQTEPAAFDKAGVTKLKTRDLKAGTGAEIKEGTEYYAYYIGWNPAGKIFDQSIDGNKLKAPIAGTNLIEGWNEGVIGMKEGGVRELTIPADKAYKDQAKGEDIPPNTPLKFIVMIVPKFEAIKEPPVPKELADYYSKNLGY